MSAYFESGVFAGEGAWHGEGVVREDCRVLSSAEALQLSGLDWTATRRPVWVQLDDQGEEGARIPDQYAVVRDSDLSVLGIVGQRHRIMQNREAFAFMDSFLGTDMWVDAAISVEGGRKVGLVCRLDGDLHIGGDRDEAMAKYLFLGNSFDGSLPITVMYTPIRVVCANTFNAAMAGAKEAYRVKHTEGAAPSLEEARRALGVGQTYFDRLEVVANVAIRTEFTDRQFLHLMNELIPLPSQRKAGYTAKGGDSRAETNAERERDLFRNLWVNAPDLQNVRRTAWAAMNVVTAFSDHHIGSRDTGRSSAAENRAKRILFDPSFKTKGLALVMASAEIK